MRRIPGYTLLALVVGTLCFGWSRPVCATSPCFDHESVEVMMEGVTVDGQPQSDLSAYTAYRVWLESVPSDERSLIVMAYSSTSQVWEQYSNVP